MNKLSMMKKLRFFSQDAHVCNGDGNREIVTNNFKNNNKLKKKLYFTDVIAHHVISGMKYCDF